MEIVIRDYQESDYNACRALFGELAQHDADIYEDPSIAGDDPGRGFDKYLGRGDRCGSWVAESNGQVVGFTGLIDTVGEEGVADIDPVVVSADYRGEGIGSRLVQHAVEEAKKKRFRFLTIRPVVRNERAFDLYVRLGFNIVGSVELCQYLVEPSNRKWKSGVTILGHKLKY
jgi:ribosomal protein S18 acetylase RimI-like enzyme